MAQPGKQPQEPLRDLLLDYMGLALCRHLEAVQALRGGAPVTGRLAAPLAQFCQHPYPSTWPDSEQLSDRLWRRFFRPAG